jgi:MoaA/NifB/PqqE/SkfB family radical SAM enzyme
MIDYKEIRSVHLEISTRCNAACPECPRNLSGVNGIVDDYPLCDMSLNQFIQIFDTNFLKQLDVFLINGNYGDFITCREGIQIIEYIRKSNSNLEITIQTNGSGQPKIWKRLAELNAKVFFSIDGNKETNHLYRRNTNFDLIINNAKEFISAGGNAEWHLIKFPFNVDQLTKIEKLSQELNFKNFFVRDADRNNYHVFNKDRIYEFSIGNPATTTDFQHYVDMYNYSKTSNKTQLYESCQSKSIDCSAKRDKSIYVAANGEVFPCCWTAFFPRTNNRRLGNDQLRTILEDFNNNALEVGLETAIDWFNALEQTWKKTSVAQGKNFICNQTCGIN